MRLRNHVKAFIHRLYFYFKFYHPWKCSLKKNGFLHLKKMGKLRYWRTHPNVYKCFFIGFYNNKKLFIKMSIHDKTIENEYKISDFINKINSPYFCKILFKKQTNIKGLKTTIVAYEYFNDLVSLKDIPIDERADVLKQLNEVVKILNNNHLYHCDLSRRNVLFNLVNKKIVIIDYGLSYSLAIKNDEVYSFEFWGSGFKISDERIEINDSEAIKNLLKYQWGDSYILNNATKTLCIDIKTRRVIT